MNRHFLFSVIALFSIIMVANAQAVGVSGQPFTAIYFEAFEDLTAFVDFGGQLSDHWTVYQGSPQIVPAGGSEAVLKMAHPLPGGTLGAFKDPTSTGLYLSNPVTANFVDGMVEFDIRFETGKQSGVSAMLIFRMQGEDTYYALRLTSTQDWTCYFAKYIGCGNWRMIGTQSEPGVFPTDSWSHVAVTVGGPRFQAYKDGVLICVAEDGAWMKGTWGGIGFQNNYYNGVFYLDNVRIPGGFQWNTYRGLPTRDHVMGRSAASMLFDHPSESGDAGPFAEINSYSAYVVKPDTRCFTDGVIEFDIFFDTIGGQKAYMTFRMQSDTEYYALRLTSTPDWESYFIKQNGWGNTEIIGTRSLGGAIPLQAWTHIKVVIRGGLFEFYKDGQLICTAYDQMWSVGAWGGVGFFSAYNKGLFHIDNIKIHIIK